MTIWVNVTTSLTWRGQPFGIVRVEHCIAQELRKSLGPKHVRYCHYVHRRSAFVECDLRFAAVLKVGENSVKENVVLGARDTRPVHASLNRAVRWLRRARDLVSEWVATSLAQFGVVRVTLVRPAQTGARNRRYGMCFAPGDVLVTLGMEWESECMSAITTLREQHNVHLIGCCHDLIPIKYPHYCVGYVADRFPKYLYELVSSVDCIACVSQHTLLELSAIIHDKALPHPPLFRIRLGSNLPTGAMPTSSPVKEVTAGNYVLYVSTIERRKNHEIVYRAFRRLAERYSPAALPRLLFVGAQGWGVGDLLNEIASDPIVRGLIIQLNQVSDSELRWLYENALFFVFPSLYEGWGLPVAEALTAGKPVIASNCGPLPEIGGDLVEYVDPWDLLGWVSAIERLWLDHGWRQRLSDHIARDYRPSGWSGAAADIARIATGLDGQPVHPFSAVRTTRPEEIVISAVICTHNRVDYLQKALGSLLQQTLPASTYEILIVDNGSDDATRDVVLNMMRSVNNLRYFFEPLLGLSRARNRGISEARGAFIAFLDDDAIADADWLEWGVRVHKEHPGGLGFVGGEVRPIWESRRPAWLSDDLLPYLSLAKVGNYATYVDGDSGLVGANMMFRVNDLIECGGFSVLLGRKGECLLSNEELVLKRALQERGLRSLYHPRVAVSHHVIPSRLTKSWFRSRFYWQGRSDALLASASADTSNARYLLEILRLFRSFARGLGHWVWLSAFKTSEEATFLAQCRVFAAWGHLHGVFLRYVR